MQFRLKQRVLYFRDLQMVVRCLNSVHVISVKEEAVLVREEI